VRDYPNFIPGTVEPEFYNLVLIPEPDCIFAMYNSGTEDIKTPSDFFTLAPHSKAPIDFHLSDYQICISDKKAKKFTFQLDYRFDENILNASYFEKNIAARAGLSLSAKDDLFQLFQRVYRKPVTAKFIVNLP